MSQSAAVWVWVTMVSFLAGLFGYLAHYYWKQYNNLIDTWKKTLRGWVSCTENLNEAYDMYEELASKYHELCGYYERAYKVLEEYELLEEVNADGDDDNDCDV